MAPSADVTPLSLKPFPVADRKPQNVADFIARVNAQPGGFRALSESKLREEAARLRARGDGVPDDDDDDDVDMSDGGDDDDADAAPDPQQARIEVLKNVDMAANTAMLTLDSVSLLLSKQNPTQASLTLSKQLREVAGIGTLGCDRLEESAITDDKEKDQASVAMGWTLMEVNKTKALAETACGFLQDEVESESRYWEDVIGVQNGGWSICRMPQERHTLGVRFGFSEAAPEFRNMGLAPMRRGDDGAVNLDSGLLGGRSERVVITYERDGRVVGRSAIAPPPDDDAPLEARVLEARNTLLSQELWHELSREARTLTAYNVRPQGSSALTYDVDDRCRVTAQLLSLDKAPPADATLPDNSAAEAIALSLHILLSYAHRHNELMRMRPLPPYFPRARGQVSYALIRPIIAHFAHLDSVGSSARSVGGLVRTLRKAGLESSFTLHTGRPPLSETGPQGPHHLSAAQALVRGMLQPSDFRVDLALLPGAALTIRGRTHLYPVTATYYHVILPPGSPLEAACPPHKDGYADPRSLADYLRAAAERLLTARFLDELPGDRWTHNVQGNAIRRAGSNTWQCIFRALPDGAAPEDPSSPTALSVSSHALVGGRAESRSFRWAGHEDDAAPVSLEQAVKDIIDACPQ